MKAPLLLLVTSVLLVQTGCVIGQRTLTLDVPAGSTITATKGKVYVASVTDDRVFQNKPSDPSIPSVDGDVNKLTTAGKDRMIGRQRNGFGHAMGDIALSGDDTVTKRMHRLVEEGLRQGGYEVVQAPEGATPVNVSVEEFWSWMTPGFWVLTFEAKIKAKVTLKSTAGGTSFIVQGYGKNHGQIAKDGNWQEAIEPAFEDFLTNFKAELAKDETMPTH